MHPHDRKIQNTSHNLNITWRIGSIYQKINSLNQHESENINSSIGPLLKCQLINFSHFWMVYVLLQNWVSVAKLVAGGFERKESFAWSQTDPLYCCAMKQMYVYTNQHTAPHTSSDLSWNCELLIVCWRTHINCRSLLHEGSTCGQAIPLFQNRSVL